MRLQKLQLLGFKTFADRTEIVLGDGMTAVVGPNGCGKSNVADAILWVLGEQNPRLLRGADSRDVIFAGTSRRKPLGYAEVRLSIDNSDHALPVQFAEVTVARRVYRSGESQYFLNQSPCRLKDIVDLFLDTGMGNGAYAFVTQNEIDAVLSARAEDRRELFEEAAGIKKYRTRKREAVRKLDHADANLTRIRDIVQELERQRQPLAQQAELATRHRELVSRLRQIEVDLLISEAQTADYELYAARRDCELDREAIAQHEATMADLERQAVACRAGLDEAERELEAARISRQSAMSSVERTESRLALLHERAGSAERSADELDRELRDLDGRVAEMTKQCAQAAALADRLAQQVVTRQGELAAARTRLADAERSLAEAVRRTDDRRGAALRHAEMRAQRAAALTALQLRVGDARQTAARLEESAAAAVRERDAAAIRVDTALAALESSRTDVSCAETNRAAAQREHADVLSQAATAREAAEGARKRLAERETRLAALREMQQAGEGLYQGVRATVNAARSGQLRGAYTPVAELLTVPEKLRTAVEVALGGSAQDIVCDSESEAKSAIEWLKRNRAGRATFLALDLLRPLRSLRGSDFERVPGVLGIASTLVSADARYAPAIDLLLGRTIVARDLEAAIRVSVECRDWGRIVTLEGEVLSPGGALTGGSLQGKSIHLIGRKGEIDDLEKEVPRVRSLANAAAAEVDRLAAEVAAALSRRETTESACASAQSRCAGAEADLRGAEREKERLCLAADQALAANDMARVGLATLEEEEHRLSAQARDGLTADATSDDAVAAEEAEVARLAGERDAVRLVLTELEVEAARLAEKSTAARADLASARQSVQQTEAARRARQQRREEAATTWSDAESEAAEAQAQLVDAREALAVCDERHATWQQQRQERLAASFERSSSLQELSGKRQEVMLEMHEAELRIARMEVRLAQTAQRLADEYGIGLDEAIARPAPAPTTRDTTNEVARLRREIRQMGDVNTGAVEEFERLTERHTFLSTQREDLERARASILEAIEEIDRNTREVFLQTFEAVSVEFERLFARLFDGGTTQLSLTDPDDLLETGIEVVAQPPGKKAQKLSLLSGGERALTAVALLFAFLRVRPSPFAVLDEVDAPLDGSNVERFVELVREFSEATQFLIITHNPATMEAAPRWYGITMQEPGVSRVISYRVPQEATASLAEEPLLPAGGRG